MITKVKIMDPLLKQREDEIDRYLDGNFLYPRIFKLIHGRHYWKWNDGEKAKYKNFLKNKPFHEIESEIKNY
jgi:hypothetical protein